MNLIEGTLNTYSNFYGPSSASVSNLAVGRFYLLARIGRVGIYTILHIVRGVCAAGRLQVPYQVFISCHRYSCHSDETLFRVSLIPFLVNLLYLLECLFDCFGDGVLLFEALLRFFGMRVPAVSGVVSSTETRIAMTWCGRGFVTREISITHRGASIFLFSFLLTKSPSVRGSALATV